MENDGHPKTARTRGPPLFAEKRAFPAAAGADFAVSGGFAAPLPGPRDATVPQPPLELRHLERQCREPHLSSMAKLAILEFPDPRLRTKAAPVTAFDAALKQLSEDMLETMYEAPGIGLAATQVNVHRQLLVLDVSEEKNQPMVLVNPKITAKEGTQVYQEGCLSVPGIFADVERADRIHVEAHDVEGKLFSFDADGLLAVCIQHEMDHLAGKLFVDYLSPLKRELVKKKLEKQRRHASTEPSAVAL
jgi:peptide deformylase